MQATTVTKHRRFDLVKLAAAAVALLALLAAGALATTFTRDDTTTRHAARSVSADAKTTANYRFMELNQLPETSVARPRRLNDQRFIEMNRLPEAPAIRSAADRNRLIDMNVLPGDDIQELPPFADRFIGPY
jgi:hypothetical protein